MTPAKANHIRIQRMCGKEPSNKARRAAQDALRRAEEGQYTITHLWDEYVAQKPDLRGFVTDKNRFEKHILPILGNMAPNRIDPLTIDRMRISLLKTHCPETVRHVLALIRRLVNFGTRKNLCEPLGFKIEMPRVSNLKTESLTSDQLKSLLRAIERSRHVQVGAMMKLALFTGMRRGEIFRLRWNDVDFERGFITIRNPKGGKDATIPLNEPARKLLESTSRTDSPYIFPGRNGGPRVDAHKQMNEIKTSAGLPRDFRAMHGLRHVYASMLASSGVDLYTVGRLLTHKSTTMTARYAHLSDAALRKASELAGRIVSNVGEKEQNINNRR